MFKALSSANTDCFKVFNENKYDFFLSLSHIARLIFYTYFCTAQMSGMTNSDIRIENQCSCMKTKLTSAFLGINKHLKKMTLNLIIIVKIIYGVMK